MQWNTWTDCFRDQETLDRRLREGHYILISQWSFGGKIWVRMRQRDGYVFARVRTQQ